MTEIFVFRVTDDGLPIWLSPEFQALIGNPALLPIVADDLPSFQQARDSLRQSTDREAKLRVRVNTIRGLVTLDARLYGCASDGIIDEFIGYGWTANDLAVALQSERKARFLAAQPGDLRDFMGQFCQLALDDVGQAIEIICKNYPYAMSLAQHRDRLIIPESFEGYILRLSHPNGRIKLEPVVS